MTSQINASFTEQNLFFVKSLATLVRATVLNVIDILLETSEEVNKFQDTVTEYEAQLAGAYIDIEEERKERNRQRRKQRNKEADIREDFVTFNPDVTEHDHILNAVRVFQAKPTYKKRRNKDKAQLQLPPARRDQTAQPDNDIEIYTDGSSTRNGSENSIAAAGIYVTNDDREIAIRLPGNIQTNQRAELIAILEAARIQRGGRMRILTDSRYCTDGFTRRIEKMEDNDFVDIENDDAWRAAIAVLRQRTGETDFKWVKGHRGIEGNERADSLADRGASPSCPLSLGLASKPKITGIRSRKQRLQWNAEQR